MSLNKRCRARGVDAGSRFPNACRKFTSMCRLLPLRLLLALFAFAGLASDSAVKVAHGEAHLAERLSFDRAVASSGISVRCGADSGELERAPAEHSVLHAITVASQRVAAIGLPAGVALELLTTVLVPRSASALTAASEARPPTCVGAPAQPRAPPLG